MSSTGSVSSSTGLVSGTDYDALIADLMEVAEKPLTQVSSKISDYEVTVSAYSTLTNDLSSLQDALDALTSTTAGFGEVGATSGDRTVVTVSADTDATVGSYDIVVSQLAVAQKVQSTDFTASEAVGAGTLTISIGETGNTTSTDITVDADDTISDIASAINEAGLGVTATVVTSGTTQVLTIKSDDTGTTNAFTISVADSDANDTDASGLSRLYYAGSGVGQMTETQEALDAAFTIDGVDVTSSSNTVDTAIEGLTFTLKGVSDSSSGTAESTTVTVSRDTDSIQSAIESFVSAYNSVVEYISSEQGYDVDTGTAGDLLGDSTVNRIKNTLKELIKDSVSGSSAIKYLSDMGITMGTDGTLSVDSDTLETALTDNFDAVKNFFTQTSSSTASGGLAVKMSEAVDSWINEDDGALTVKSDGLEDTIARLEDRQEAMQSRLDKQEALLTSKFNALEVLLSDYSTTASSVDSLITAMENLNSQISGG